MPDLSDLKNCDKCGKTIRPGQPASPPVPRATTDKNAKTEYFRVHTDRKDCPALGPIG